MSCGLTTDNEPQPSRRHNDGSTAHRSISVEMAAVQRIAGFPTSNTVRTTAGEDTHQESRRTSGPPATAPPPGSALTAAPKLSAVGTGQTGTRWLSGTRCVPTCPATRRHSSRQVLSHGDESQNL